MSTILLMVPLLIAPALIATVSIVVRLKNPELTETQLFLKFWKLWTCLIVLALIAGGYLILLFTKVGT